MNVIGVRPVGQTRAIARHGLLSALVLLLPLAGARAWAQDEAPHEAILLAQAAPQHSDDRPRSQLEVSAGSLPLFNHTDGATRASRVDMTWLPPRRSALGLSVGMSSTNASAVAQSPSFTTGPASVNLGLHWRYTPDGNYRIDVTAWRRILPADTLTLVKTREPTYGARVEMRIGPKPLKAGLVADRGFIGFQLESGARITLRRSQGKPMLYYRTKF